MKQLLTLLLAIALFPMSAAAQTSKPNVIVILCDDLGQGDPQCYNAKSKIPTPNIDRLAMGGMHCNNAHTPSSVCTPTRYSTLTGRYCWRSSLKKGVLNGWSNALIKHDRPTIASMLKPHGYTSSAIGKWHMGWNWRDAKGKEITDNQSMENVDFGRPVAYGPGAVGFDHCDLIPASLDMDPYLWLVDDKAEKAPTSSTSGSKRRWDGGGGYWRAGAMQPGFDFYDVLPRSTRSAIAMIDGYALSKRTPDTKPFFLYLPLPAPHTPWMPTPEFQGKSKAGYYGDFVVQLDACLGQILDALDRNGIAQDTLIFFTSDNGSHWPEGQVKQWGHDANNTWQGQKADIQEAGHRVPFIVRWPGTIQPNTTSDQTVCLTDIYATVADAVGHKLADNEGEDSVSLMPIFMGTDDKPLREATVHHSLNGTFAIRKGDWKYVDGLGSGGFTKIDVKVEKKAGFEGQLYNLKDDPHENANLWKDKPEIVAELSGLLEKYKADGRSR